MGDTAGGDGRSASGTSPSGTSPSGTSPSGPPATAASAEGAGVAAVSAAAGWDRVLTVPNGISLARLLGVPVFLWLVLGPKAYVWAVVLLVAAGLSDWLDGKIARALNQRSHLGEALDPAADRLYIGVTLLALAIERIVPWWLVGILFARDVLVTAALWVLRRRIGVHSLRVSFIGKAATLCLLYAFPLLLLGAHPGTWPTVARIIGWAFGLWGAALYWSAAMLYLAQAKMLLSSRSTPLTTTLPNGHRRPLRCKMPESARRICG